MCQGDKKEKYWVVAEFIAVYMRRMQMSSLPSIGLSCCFPGFNLTVCNTQNHICIKHFSGGFRKIRLVTPAVFFLLSMCPQTIPRIYWGYVIMVQSLDLLSTWIRSFVVEVLALQERFFFNLYFHGCFILDAWSQGLGTP